MPSDAEIEAASNAIRDVEDKDEAAFEFHSHARAALEAAERVRDWQPMVSELMAALKNGHEGGFASNWNEDDSEAGFWIPAEDYQRLLAAVKAAIGERTAA